MALWLASQPLVLASRDDVQVKGDKVLLPASTLAVLSGETEETG